MGKSPAAGSTEHAQREKQACTSVRSVVGCHSSFAKAEEECRDSEDPSFNHEQLVGPQDQASGGSSSGLQDGHPLPSASEAPPLIISASQPGELGCSQG